MNILHLIISNSLLSAFALLLLLILPLAGCGKEPEQILAKQTIDKDTTWSGSYVIGGDIRVPPGVTLTIAPGTIVRFKKIDEKSDQNLFIPDSPYYPQAELIVEGRLLARGTADKWIVFTSAERDPQPADWGAINFLGGDGNEMEYVKVLCAYNGIHAHGSTVTVTHSEFVRNGVGISFKSEEETPGVPWYGKRSNLTITRSLFAKNKGGIGFRNSDGLIANNEIMDNKFFGVWPKENSNVLVTHNEITRNLKGVYLFQSNGVRFEYNNIYDNREYDIAVAEAQDYEVDARNNYFGTIDRRRIDEVIFDKHDDFDLGEVLVEPFLQKAAEVNQK